MNFELHKLFMTAIQYENNNNDTVLLSYFFMIPKLTHEKHTTYNMKIINNNIIHICLLDINNAKLV